MKKHLIHFSLLFLFFNTHVIFAQQNKWTSIKAFLPKWNGAEISLFCDNQSFFKTVVKDDIVSFRGNIDKISLGSLQVKSGKKSFYIPFFLEPGTVKIRDAGNNILVAYGTPSNDLYVQLNKNFDSIAAQQKNLSFAEALRFKRKLAATFIQNNPSSIVSVQLLKDYFYLASDADDTLYFSLVHLVDPAFCESFYMKEMKKEANNRYATAVGRPAPVLQLYDTSGRVSSLYEGGCYTLIDFWASWCLPCRKENNALKRLFQKYMTAGFSITSVSLDENKMFWLHAISQDKLSWKQLNDFKGWNSPVTITYGVKAIPMNYLINRDGVIIAKNLHAEQIDILLATILEK